MTKPEDKGMKQMNSVSELEDSRTGRGKKRKRNPDNMFEAVRDEGELCGGGVGPPSLWSQFEDLVMQNQSSATDSSHGNAELPKFLVDK